MGNDNKENRNYAGCWILYALTGFELWVALIISKARGTIAMNWPAAILGIVWVPALLLGFLLGLAGVLALLKTATHRIREWKRRRKIARTLWEAMEGLTLNSIGPIYGVRRKPGEKNRSFKRRILKAARTVDAVNIQKGPKPATGENLDRVAQRYGLKRRPGEADEQLRNRIEVVALAKLKGGGQND